MSDFKGLYQRTCPYCPRQVFTKTQKTCGLIACRLKYQALKNSPAFRKKRSIQVGLRQMQRYHNDPEYREMRKAYQRERYQNDPEVRAKANAYKRKQCQNDPEYKEKQKAYYQEWYKKRFQNDPEYREMRKAYNRELHHNSPKFRDKKNAPQTQYILRKKETLNQGSIK